MYQCPMCGRGYDEPGLATYCHPEVKVMPVPQYVQDELKRKREESLTVELDAEPTWDPDEEPRNSNKQEEILAAHTNYIPPDWEEQQTKAEVDKLKSLKNPVPGLEDPGCELTRWGDKVTTHTTGAKRANGGKIRWDLMPIAPMRDTAMIWTFGADKYGDRNWEQGFDWSGPYASMMRHLQAWFAGEDFDPESGMSHLAHAACNLQMLQQFEYTHKAGDNRPHNSCPPARRANAETIQSARNKNSQEKPTGSRPSRW